MRLNFDCVFHHVADVDAAIRFYRDLLGLRLTSRDVVARFDIDGVRFELVPDPHPGRPRSGGGAHLCLGTSDLTEARHWLKDKGVEVSEAVKVEGGALATFRDPDGNEIFLWQSSRAPH